MPKPAARTSRTPPLQGGCVVVDFSTGLAGPYCTRLFAAAGADVVKVESGPGDPMRWWSPTGAPPGDGDSAMFRFLNEGKRGARGSVGEHAVDELLGEADLVVESFTPAQLDVEGLRARFPRLVVLSITPWGRTGPYADRVASDFTVDAEAGAYASRGRPEGMPLRIGARITECIAGAYAAVAALAALRRAWASGVGEHVDCSLAETALVANTCLLPMRHELAGRPPITEAARRVESPGVEPTADGWVGLTTRSRQQFDDLLVMIERPDLIGNDDWATAHFRSEHFDEWNEILHGWTRRHTTAEILELASLLRIPCAPVHDGSTVRTFEQFVACDSFGPCDDGSFSAPRPPIRLDGERLQAIGRAPRLGDHGGPAPAPSATVTPAPLVPTAPPAAAAAPADGDGRGAPRPLAGLRVLDATNWYAGPIAGELLAALGADVIHLESHVRLEGGRTHSGAGADPAWWERGVVFHQANVGKRSLAVDLNSAEGRGAVRRVIAACDLVLENYSPRVFEHFGFDWDELRRVNPRVGFVRMPAFGLDGPWRDGVGFGDTMEQVTGLAWLTGVADEPPCQPSGPCDPLAGSHGAFGALLALEQRDRTGRGAFVEVAMAEAVLNAASESAVEWSAYGRCMQRDGNRRADAAPQGLYRCRGVEQWLALTITSDADWDALQEVMGRPGWADDRRYDHLEGRRAGHDVIDAQLGAWTATQDLGALVERLVAAGVAAGRLTDPRVGYEHPQFGARRLYEELDHPVVGRLAVAAIPFRFASVERWFDAPAPTLGQHNLEVLRDVAGLDGAAIRELERDGVIGRELVTEESRR